MLLDTLETGRIIAKKVSEFSFTRMEINMKECGEEIKDMVRELIGEMKTEN